MANTTIDGAPDPAPESANPRRNFLGTWAVVTGAVLLFPIALILGYLGLRAVKGGEANNKSVAMAGVILGYVGLVSALVAVGLVLFVVWPSATAQHNDNAAKADVISIGNAVVKVTSAGGTVSGPLEQQGSAWLVADEAVAMELRVEQAATVTGSSPTDWCVNLHYQGGNASDVSYSSTTGLITAANCGL